MTKFIKLAYRLINPRYIHKIYIYNNSYSISMHKETINGYNWSCFGYGVGTINSTNETLIVCAIENPSDYKVVSEWILNNWLDQSVLFYALQIPSDNTKENMSDMARDLFKNGYSVADYEKPIPEEYKQHTLGAELPALRWKTDHMDIYDAYMYVGDMYKNHVPKFREVIWNLANRVRDYRQPLDEILKHTAYQKYSPEATLNRDNFFKNYIEKKLNYSSKN